MSTDTVISKEIIITPGGGWGCLGTEKTGIGTEESGLDGGSLI